MSSHTIGRCRHRMYCTVYPDIALVRSASSSPPRHSCCVACVAGCDVDKMPHFECSTRCGAPARRTHDNTTFRHSSMHHDITACFLGSSKNIECPIHAKMVQQAAMSLHMKRGNSNGMILYCLRTKENDSKQFCNVIGR